jgi:hypothetical protein
MKTLQALATTLLVFLAWPALAQQAEHPVNVDGTVAAGGVMRPAHSTSEQAVHTPRKATSTRLQKRRIPHNHSRSRHVTTHHRSTRRPTGPSASGR